MDEAFSFVLLMLASTLRVATPLVLCAMGGLFSEKSGIVDVGLEGKMLMAAFFAAATASVTGSVWAGVAAAILAAEALALLHGLACITYRGNQVVSGVAINILAAGLTVVLGTAWFARGGQTPPLLDGQRLMPLFLPRAGDNVLVYVALLSVPLTWWVIARTRFGLRLRAVGEMPLAVDAAGLSVAWLRYRAVLLCGLLLVLGLFSRPVAFVLSGKMAFVYFMGHATKGFFPVFNGGEAAMLLFFVFLYIAAAGPGVWSLDAVLGKNSGTR